MAGKYKTPRSLVTDLGSASTGARSEGAPRGKSASRAKRADTGGEITWADDVEALGPDPIDGASMATPTSVKVAAKARSEVIGAASAPPSPVVAAEHGAMRAPSPETAPPPTFTPRLPRTKSIELSSIVGSVATAEVALGYDRDGLEQLHRAQQQPSSSVELVEMPFRSNDPRLFMVNVPDGPQAAAYRVLRHHVLANGAPRVIAVTSPNDGAGKTATAVNLAIALAECAQANVLVIEANFRRPSLARLFQFDPNPGFGAQIARFHREPGAPWRITSFADIYLHVAALAPDREPAALVDAPAFRYALDGLRAVGYDHIIIDCPSVLAGSDVNIIQDSADGLLLVAQARATTARRMRRAIDRLQPGVIMGSVLFGE